MSVPTYVAKKWADRVMFWDDERKLGNSLIVMLKDGFRFPTTECHTQGFDTVQEAVEGLRDTVVCTCPACLIALGNRG